MSQMCYGGPLCRQLSSKLMRSLKTRSTCGLKTRNENPNNLIYMKRLRIKPYQTKREEALKDGDDCLVWATHPYIPNRSMNARGRVIHIERSDDKFDFPSTYCGMMAVEYAKDSWRKVCIQCSIVREQEKKCLNQNAASS